jgi:heme exporter protein C
MSSVVQSSQPLGALSSLKGLWALMGLSFALIFVGIVLAFFVAPVEGTLGIVQKIFYFHVPAAFSSYVGFVLCAVGSVSYLLRASRWSDRLAQAGAEVGVLFAAIVLITGPLWGYKSWGDYWEWEPRLTSMLLTFLIYCAYLLLRAFGGEGEVARKIGAVMGTLGVVGVVVVHISVRLWGGVHPQVMTGQGGGLHPLMKPAYFVCIFGFLALTSALIWLRMRLGAQHALIEDLHLRAADVEYDLEQP